MPINAPAYPDCSKNRAAGGNFPPEQKEQLIDQLHQSPENFGLPFSRWSLERLRHSCTWLESYSLSGIWRVLQAWGEHFKRGQPHVHSPDPDYRLKKQRIQACVAAARRTPGEVVTLFLDEFSFYRWPTPAPAYFRAGRFQPLARLVPSYNTRSRIIAALEVVQGRVLYRQRSRITLGVLVDFLEDIRTAFPQAQQIFLIQDNWHQVHFHPDQVQAAARLGIELVPLPTYAPWLNPIEKLGRKLRQEVMHMHPQAGEWDTLKVRVEAFFSQFAQGSPQLVKYVGLLPD
jgi:hypothetical protein